MRTPLELMWGIGYACLLRYMRALTVDTLCPNSYHFVPFSLSYGLDTLCPNSCHFVPFSLSYGLALGLKLWVR